MINSSNRNFKNSVERATKLNKYKKGGDNRKRLEASVRGTFWGKVKI